MLQHYTIPERHVICSVSNNNRVKQKLNLMHGFMRIKSDKNLFYIVLISERKRIQRNRYYSTVKNHRHSWHGLTTPLCSNFLFANLFSMKFLYFFIISSLFPYFILFVSIFIQSYVNIKLHVSTLYCWIKLPTKFL
jgi:cellulose synthase/poly-beta-1,6-N-acetylglucosamine synthase-like glycosyltransferase